MVRPSRGAGTCPGNADRTPYRVWVSEIMLQQTQVATVIPYFEAFMTRFPDVRVTGRRTCSTKCCICWSGLGYYARARNLHRAATELVAAPRR